MADLQQAATALLQRLIQFDTVNPPGHERAAQEHLAGVLEAAGFEVTLVGPEPERLNLVARLPGAADGPRLGFLSHVDTVLANPAEWTHDPWSGDLADGCVWGRGALDMKSQTAAEIAAALDLAASGWRPAAGELVVMVMADEETGGHLGAHWMTEHHADLVRCDYVLNEGGGDMFVYGGRRYLALGCAEKGVFRFAVTTDGVAGHASIPKMGDNALLKMAPILAALGDRQPSFDVTEEPRALLAALAPGVDDPAAALAQVAATAPRLAFLIEPMLGVTLTPTRIRASEKVNVIPSEAVLQVDCRVPPGLGEAEALARAEEVLGRDGHRIEFFDRVVGNRSSRDTPFADAIAEWLAEHDPKAVLVPSVLPGFTDSRWFREAFPDCVAYGFFPHMHMAMHETAPLIHSADERIDVRDLGVAASFYRHIARRMLG